MQNPVPTRHDANTEDLKKQQRHKTSILRILSKLLRLLGEIHLLESHDFEQPLQKDFAHFRQKISRQETLNNVGGK